MVAALLAIAVGGVTAAASQTASSSCVQALDALSVVAVCNGSVGSGLRISSLRGRLFEAGPEPNVARLRGVPLAPGDRIAITGTADAAAVALDIGPRGTARLVRFTNLGLAHGGRATLTVSGRSGKKVFRLVRPDGTSVSPTSITTFAGRQYIGPVMVRRTGGKAEMTFTPISATTEVALLSHAATENMLEEGELEDPFLVGKTIKTRPGVATHVTLPLRPLARWAYVKPLAPRLVLPGLAPLP